jgi:DNA mismatch endonuclease, patch repair protein
MTDNGAAARRTSRELRPPASSDVVRQRMKGQARSNTAPELAVRRLLYARGVRYRLHVPVPGLPRRSIDICLKGRKIAIFLDGCFWHGCPLHATAPKSNAAWWHTKLAANQQRDIETTAHLEELGWEVLRFWTHMTAEVIVDQVRDTIRTIDAMRALRRF